MMTSIVLSLNKVVFLCFMCYRSEAYLTASLQNVLLKIDPCNNYSSCCKSLSLRRKRMIIDLYHAVSSSTGSGNYFEKINGRDRYERTSSCSRSGRSSVSLESSSSSSSSSSLLDVGQELSLSSLKKSYRVGVSLFTSLAITLFVIPDRTLTRKLAAKFGGASGFGLAAWVSYILSNAAATIPTQQNKTNKDYSLSLSSDTCKRLNLGLIGFFLLGLTAIPGEAGFLYSPNLAILLSGIIILVRMFGVSMAYNGWKRGVAVSDCIASSNNDNNNITTFTASPVPTKDLLKELMNGIKTTLRGALQVKNKKKTLMYRNSLLLVLIGTISSFMEGHMFVRFRDTLKVTLFDISLQWSAVSRLFLIMAIIYSLKEAAENDLLNETAFMQMNCMIGSWAFLVGIGQGIRPFGFFLQRVEMLTFSLLFFIKGLKPLKLNSDRKKEEAKLQSMQDDATETDQRMYKQEDGD